jgi:hypothetical protein
MMAYGYSSEAPTAGFLSPTTATAAEAVTAGRRGCIGRSAAHGRLHGRGDRAWRLHETPLVSGGGGLLMARSVRSAGDEGGG